MTKDKNNKRAGAGAGAAKAPEQPKAPGETTGVITGDAKPKRTRNKLSPQKQFAIMIAGLVAILNQADVATLLTDAQKAQVTSAENAAKELNEQTITPVKNRIAAIKVELAEAGAALQKPDADLGKLAGAVADLNKELLRKQKQLAELEKAA